jgi:hypothetical protein
MINKNVTVFHDGPVISHRDAATAGMKYYFTGKPCKKYHIAQRYTSGFSCVICLSLQAKKWHTENPERALLKARKYRERNPERMELATAKWRAAHPEVVRQTAREWREQNPERLVAYLTAERLKEITKREVILGRKRPCICEACGGVEIPIDKGTRIVFDHCHNTDRPRGWICHSCNIALGHVKDSPEKLHQLIHYLEMFVQPCLPSADVIF